MSRVAARGARVSSVEILVAWPGVHALLAHRIAHALHEQPLPDHATLDRLRQPRADRHRATAEQIGDGLFIDHGSSVVIGETAEMATTSRSARAVTLGGTGFATGKRHPTVEDNVTIGSGAELSPENQSSVTARRSPGRAS